MRVEIHVWPVSNCCLQIDNVRLPETALEFKVSYPGSKLHSTVHICTTSKKSGSS